MRTTYPEAEFNFIDVTALEDSRAVSASAKEFAEPALFLGKCPDEGLWHNGAEPVCPGWQQRDISFTEAPGCAVLEQRHIG